MDYVETPEPAGEENRIGDDTAASRSFMRRRSSLTPRMTKKPRRAEENVGIVDLTRSAGRRWYCALITDFGFRGFGVRSLVDRRVREPDRLRTDRETRGSGVMVGLADGTERGMLILNVCIIGDRFGRWRNDRETTSFDNLLVCYRFRVDPEVRRNHVD